jgi:hypothetical protein
MFDSYPLCIRLFGGPGDSNKSSSTPTLKEFRSREGDRLGNASYHEDIEAGNPEGEPLRPPETSESSQRGNDSPSI